MFSLLFTVVIFIILLLLQQFRTKPLPKFASRVDGSVLRQYGYPKIYPRNYGYPCQIIRANKDILMVINKKNTRLSMKISMQEENYGQLDPGLRIIIRSLFARWRKYIENALCIFEWEVT